VFCTINLAHGLVLCGAPSLLDILRSFESVQQIVTECLVKVQRDARNDLG
jgi:hypothetical protein